MVLDRAFDSWWMKYFFVYKTELGYLIKLMELIIIKKEKKYFRKIIYSKNFNKDINFYGFKEYVNLLRFF